MTKPQVDLDELIQAMTMCDNMGFDFAYYLDRTTGAVRKLEDPRQYENCSWAVELVQELKALKKELTENPENFVEIENISSHDDFQIMRDFTDSLPARIVKQEALQEALAMRKPFQQFRHALERYPDLRTAYFEFQDAARKKIAEEWLAEQNLDFELVTAHK